MRSIALLALVGLAMQVQSCAPGPSTLKTPFIPPEVATDTLGPRYLRNVSQIDFWDRISSVNRATNFAWWDSSGTVRQMYDYYDKVVVLSFFATWSPPALTQLPVLDSAIASGDTNTLFIGIAMREGVTAGKAVLRLDSFVRARKIGYPVLIGSRDFGFTYGGVDVVPMTFVITRRRKIDATFEGFVSTSRLLEAIAKAEAKH